MSNTSQKLLSRDLTIDDCKYWMKNKRKNPISKYTLNENSKILKEIQKQCTQILEKHEKPKNVNIKKTLDEPSNNDNIIIEKTNTIKSDNKNIINNSYYPDLNDEDFTEKLAKLYEFYLYKVPDYEKVKSKDDYYKKSEELCGDFEKTQYQYFISHYISSRTPYKSILLYHGVGVGKTCSAITLAESFLRTHSSYEEPKIWVIMPHALKQSFKEQIFSLLNYEENFNNLRNQCTGDLYIKLASILKNSDKDKIKQNIKKLIKSRYKLFTYEMFASYIQTEYIDKNRVVHDKVIIIDEAHNIRSNDNLDKKVYSILVNVANTGINNRFVLLSATPMYNKAEDIFYLMYLLSLNDKRNLLNMPFPSLFDKNNNINKESYELIKKLSNNYISYLRGKNPFTFALKLSPQSFYKDVKYLTHECKLDSNGNEIPNKFKNWVSNLEDSVVISELGEKQYSVINKLKSNVNEHNLFTNTQPMNIVYDEDVGEKGFNTFFTRVGNNTINVNYNKKYMNALFPDKNNLGKYSGKFLNICNIIKNTEGIVVIYSNYIWSGIIPMAVCLEHMGYNREGSDNILKNSQIINNPPKYGFNTSPKYCILSSDNSEVMGTTSIDSLIKKINNDNNIDGSKIKVVLMTPVASEGLSFYNVREMHIIEPWFHFNKATQVIGRGIRNCRHQLLPIEKRNVSVFIHASYINDQKETVDIHSLRISSIKLIETNILDKIIRDNSIDCFLMKNINYFPKDLFELGKMKIITSQKMSIDYEFGDNNILEPMCKNVVPNNYSGMRYESISHFIFSIQNRIRKMIINYINEEKWFIPLEEFVNKINIDKEIIYHTIKSILYPFVLIDGYILVTHNNGIHIIKIINEKEEYIKLINDKPIEKKQFKCSYKEISKILSKPIDEASVALYLSLDKTCLIEIVKNIIETKDILDEQSNFIAKCLEYQGVLITNNEISGNVDSKYIGYVNIYNDKFEPILYTNGKYRDLTDKEINQLISNRILRPQMPNMNTETIPWGMIVFSEKNNKNIFKIFTTGKGNGIKTGRECSSMDKHTHNSLLKQLNQKEDGSKQENCILLLKTLIKMKRLTMNPIYIPK